MALCWIRARALLVDLEARHGRCLQVNCKCTRTRKELGYGQSIHAKVIVDNDDGFIELTFRSRKTKAWGG